MINESKYTAEFKNLMLKNSKMDFNAPATVSSILLFRHYLSRLKQIKTALGINEFYINYEEFDNLFLNISSTWKDEILPLDTFFTLLVKPNCSGYHLSRTSFNSLFIYLFVNWEIFKGKEELKSISNWGNPYQPIIKIILKNQLIRIVEGHFHISNIIYLKKGQNKFILPSLNDDFLDSIDNQYPIKVYEPQNVPTQDDVNMLWGKFNS